MGYWFSNFLIPGYFSQRLIRLWRTLPITLYQLLIFKKYAKTKDKNFQDIADISIDEIPDDLDIDEISKVLEDDDQK